MNKLQIGITGLVKSALTGEKTVLPSDFNPTSALSLAKRHQIVPLIYYGITNSEIKVPENIFTDIENITYQSIAVSHNQLFELENLYKAFEESGIEYMPLKGAVIKNLYPKPEMRTMGDADILIRQEQYGEIRVAMQSLGFTEVIESDHELIWNKNNIHLELHKRLIPSYNKDYYEYYGNGWKLAIPEKGFRYKMSDEDTFVYLFTHYAKHYRDGGIGIRHITDLYVYLSAKPNLNKTYIETELEKLKLLEFYNNTVHTLDVWFKGEKPDEMSDFITGKIFESGSYGTYVSHIVSGAYKASGTGKNARLKKAFGLIFLPYKYMVDKYPVLKKAPFLLPIMWIVRIADVIFNKRDKIAKQRKTLDYITDEKISEYKKELEFVGLDFNFKRSNR